MLPIDLRNALFALFLTALENPKRASNFKMPTPTRSYGEPLEAGDVAYLEDRMPRFERVLDQLWTEEKFDDPFLQDIRVGELLFNAGLFFDCHEYHEARWKEAEGDVKILLQGLIQAAAGFHKLELGSVVGCSTLLKRAEEKLSRKSVSERINLQAFVQGLQRASIALKKGGFVLADAPRMEILISSRP